MGLIIEELEVTLSSSNTTHYESLGYNISRVKRYGRLVIPKGTTIKVKTNDLMRGSSEVVTVQCDHCGKILKAPYYQYTYCNHDGLYYCNICSSTVLVSGENNVNWNFSLTEEERKSKRMTPKYRTFVRTVLKRDDYTCQCCKVRNPDDMDVHHLDGYNWCVEKRYDIQNGITLCRNCHKNFHAKYGSGDNTKEQFEEWFGDVSELINKNIEILPNRQVYCLEKNKIYKDTLEASTDINVDRTTMAYACSSYAYSFEQNKKFLKSLKGYHFFWYDEFLKLTQQEIDMFLIKCQNSHFKKVICLTTNEIFDTIRIAADKYNLKCSVGISNCCKGKANSSGKLSDGTPLKWMYYEDYLKLQNAS